MKAKLKFDEESGTLIARIEKCPKTDGTSGTIEWEMGMVGNPFMGLNISPEALRAMDGQEIEVKDPEKLWDIQKGMSAGCKISPSGFKFRFHRGGYEDSMSTCITLDSVADLEKLVSETYGLDIPLTFKFEYQGLDRRNGWKTYMVICEDFPVGYTDGIPAGAPTHYPSAPITPETCPNCGAKLIGGATGPDEEMKPDHRVFYVCGAAISLRIEPGGEKLIYLTNCSELPEQVKKYQVVDGKWRDVDEYGEPLVMTAYKRMKVRECIGLLNSMIRGGESHSDVSKEAVRKAFEYLNGET